MDADCSTIDLITTDFSCSCKTGYTHTASKADGEVCYDQRRVFAVAHIYASYNISRII